MIIGLTLCSHETASYTHLTIRGDSVSFRGCESCLQSYLANLPVADRVYNLLALARTFPTFEELEPWYQPFGSADALREALQEPSGGSPALGYLIAFLRAVAGMTPLESFAVLPALAEWAEEDREAFAAWARAPWFMPRPEPALLESDPALPLNPT